jgi:tetratricopeptide (TPR) repeat protein
MNSLKFSRLLAALALLALTTAVLYPVLQAGFLDWDDCVYVTENQAIKSLTLESAGKLLTSFHLGLYKPLPLLTFALEYKFFGLEPAAFHATSLALHLANTLLVFFIVANLAGGTAAPFAAALLFGVHPMHVESVAWIAERKDMLFGLFFLLSILFYQRYRAKASTAAYFLSAAAFALSLTAKPMGVTLPAALLLLDYLEGRKPEKKVFLEKLPFLALAGFFTALALHSAGSAKVYQAHEGYTSLDNFLVGFHGLLAYVKRLFLPLDLSAVYPYPLKEGGRLPLAYLLSPLAALAVFGPILWLARSSRKAVFGVLFFLVTILPGLQFLPVSPSTAFDHYTYIPYLGPFYLAGLLFAWAWERRRAYALPAALAAAALGWLAHSRAQVWRDNLTLWSDVLASYPASEMALANRTLEYYRRGQFSAALADAQALARLAPASAKTYINRGAVYAGLKERDKAWADFNRALELEPGNWQALLNRGNIQLERGDAAGAAADYKKTLAANPYSADAYARLNALCPAASAAACLLANAENALKAAPDFAPAYAQRADARARSGRFLEALDDAGRALALDPALTQARVTRGYVFLEAGRPAEALAELEQALALDAKEPAALSLKAAALLQAEKPR